MTDPLGNSQGTYNRSGFRRLDGQTIRLYGGARACGFGLLVLALHLCKSRGSISNWLLCLGERDIWGRGEEGRTLSFLEMGILGCILFPEGCSPGGWWVGEEGKF
jgi:hypothetical protein